MAAHKFRGLDTEPRCSSRETQSSDGAALNGNPGNESEDLGKESGGPRERCGGARDQTRPPA